MCPGKFLCPKKFTCKFIDNPCDKENCLALKLFSIVYVNCTLNQFNSLYHKSIEFYKKSAGPSFATPKT